MLPRFVPPRAVLRAFAWIAFAPVAWLGARDPLLAVGLLVAPFVAIVALRAWSTLLGAASVFAAVYLALRPGIPSKDAAVLAALNAVLFALMTTKSRRVVPTLDAKLGGLVPHAFWLTLLGVDIRNASTFNHVHGAWPKVGAALIAIAVALAITSAFAWLALRRTTAQVYRKERAHLRVRGSTDVVDALPLSNVPILDAVLVEGATHEAAGPYRAGDGRVIARVPADARVLARHHATRIALSVFAAAASVGLAAMTSSVAHDADLASTPTTLPPLPPSCAEHPLTLRFAALGGTRVIDIEAFAARYRATGIATNVVVERPLLYREERFLDLARGQLIGEELLRAARVAYEPKPDELVVLVTDRDMFLREMTWRYAFATREPGVAVVSTARMDPNFPLLAPATYERTASECSATLRARAFRMITRQVLLGACRAPTIEDPHSARRTSVLGVSDLDAIDEATY